MPKTLSVNEIINLVKETNLNDGNVIYIPSLQKEISVKPMTAVHLKNIIKTTVSGVFSNTIFNQSFYSILKDILPEDVNTESLTLIDKIVMMLQLRILNVRPTVKIDMENVGNKDDKKEIEFNLSKIISKIKKYKFYFDSKIIESGQYKVELQCPNVDQEFLFDRFFQIKHIDNIDENDKGQLKSLLGPLFLKEMAQYIKNVTIQTTAIDFYKLSVEQRTSIVEQFPSKLITQILDSIDTVYGKQINDIITVEKTIDDVTYKGTIDIDASLFA